MQKLLLSFLCFMFMVSTASAFSPMPMANGIGALSFYENLSQMKSVFKSVKWLGKDEYYSDSRFNTFAIYATPHADIIGMEVDENGEIRTKVFYCDSNRPDQKGSIEVNHEFIRRIIPKGTSLDEYTQYDINLMMSHINSYGRKRFNDRSPYRMFKAMYGEEVTKRLGIEKIPRDEINLTPELLKK